MISAALIGAGSAAAAAEGAPGEGDCAGDEAAADAGGGAAVAEGGARAPAATASDAASAHAPGKSAAMDERAGRGTGASYRKSRGTSRANYFMHETVKLSRIHGMLAHRAKTAPTD
jgi:hypothetical protein